MSKSERKSMNDAAWIQYHGSPASSPKIVGIDEVQHVLNEINSGTSCTVSSQWVSVHHSHPNWKAPNLEMDCRSLQRHRSISRTSKVVPWEFDDEILVNDRTVHDLPPRSLFQQNEVNTPWKKEQRSEFPLLQCRLQKKAESSFWKSMADMMPRKPITRSQSDPFSHEASSTGHSSSRFSGLPGAQSKSTGFHGSDTSNRGATNQPKALFNSPAEVCQTKEHYLTVNGSQKLFLDTMKAKEGNSNLPCNNGIHESLRMGSFLEDDAGEEEGGRGWKSRESEREDWDLQVKATLGCRHTGFASSDVIGAIDFDESGEFFATGGIARKVRIYSLPALLATAEEASSSSHRKPHRKRTEDRDSEDREDEAAREDQAGDEEDEGFRRRPGLYSSSESYGMRKRSYDDLGSLGTSPVLDRDDNTSSVLCAPARLSSLKWVPRSNRLVGCGDYDGVFSEWDLEKGLTVTERDEHGGQQVWSIDYSKISPNLCASASDDGTVRLWSAGMEQSSAVLRAPSGKAICSAEFSPVSDRLLAMCGADTAVYLYDLRSSREPLLCLEGHSRTASAVRFAGPTVLASASIDSTVRVWDISSSGGNLESRSGSTGRQISLLHDHQNSRNFVGLSIKGGSHGGLLATGSETNEVMAYKYSVGERAGGRKGERDFYSRSLLTLPFSESSGRALSRPNQRGSFVSAVCWRQLPDDATLVAANSEGIVRILQGAKERN